jgi:hypothetical protein
MTNGLGGNQNRSTYACDPGCLTPPAGIEVLWRHEDRHGNGPPNNSRCIILISAHLVEITELADVDAVCAIRSLVIGAGQ